MLSQNSSQQLVTKIQGAGNVKAHGESGTERLFLMPGQHVWDAGPLKLSRKLRFDYIKRYKARWWFQIF